MRESPGWRGLRAAPVVVLACLGWAACCSTPSRSFDIRKARQGDAGSIARLVRRSFRGAVEWRDGPVIWTQQAAAEVDLAAGISARLTRPMDFEELLVAEDTVTNLIIGCADVHLVCYDHATGACTRQYSSARAGDWGYCLRPYLSNLGVLSSARRRGVASALVQRCETLVQSWGYDEVMLEVVQANIPATRLYRKLGYGIEPCDEQVQRVVRKGFWLGHEWVPKLRLVKALDQPSPSSSGGTPPLAPSFTPQSELA